MCKRTHQHGSTSNNHHPYKVFCPVEEGRLLQHLAILHSAEGGREVKVQKMNLHIGVVSWSLRAIAIACIYHICASTYFSSVGQVLLSQWRFFCRKRLERALRPEEQYQDFKAFSSEV